MSIFSDSIESILSELEKPGTREMSFATRMIIDENEPVFTKRFLVSRDIRPFLPRNNWSEEFVRLLEKRMKRVKFYEDFRRDYMGSFLKASFSPRDIFDTLLGVNQYVMLGSPDFSTENSMAILNPDQYFSKTGHFSHKTSLIEMRESFPLLQRQRFVLNYKKPNDVLKFYPVVSIMPEDTYFSAELEDGRYRNFSYDQCESISVRDEVYRDKDKPEFIEFILEIRPINARKARVTVRI